MSSTIQTDIWTQFSQNPHLEYKRRCITDPFSRMFIQVVTTNTNLTSLDLEGCLISNNFIAKLVNVVTNLKSLSMKCVTFHEGLVAPFINAMAINTSLTSLNLASCNFKNEIPFLITALIVSNTTLKTLNLSYGHIKGEYLANTFASNFTLSSIDLTGNSLRDSDIKLLAESLKTNSSLETLYLGANFIYNEGAIALAHSLKLNTTLTFLSLENNNIGADGAAAFSCATQLKTLYLTGNQIETEGVIRLLDSNTTLTYLKLFACKLTEDRDKLFEILIANTTLTSLNLSYTDINIANILPLIDSNTFLTSLWLREDQFRNVSDYEFNHLLTYLNNNPSLTILSISFENNRLEEIFKITDRNSYNQIRRNSLLFDLLFIQCFESSENFSTEVVDLGTSDTKRQRTI